MPSAERLDAVTIDAMGTLVELDAPVERLAQALQDRGLDTSPERVAVAFRTEVGYYLAHKLGARDAIALGELRRECSRVFLEAAGAPLDADDFTPAFVDAMVFQPLAGAVEALHRLRAAGLALACVSDWDIGLDEQLEAVGLDHLFELVLTSAEVGAAKPDPKLFVEATAQLGVEPGRTVHVGDGEGDSQGAEAAGLGFEPVPLATVPDRLGVQ
jgi:HAD superfamily hydrolase (TIGR01509 family)